MAIPAQNPEPADAAIRRAVKPVTVYTLDQLPAYPFSPANSQRGYSHGTRSGFDAPQPGNGAGGGAVPRKRKPNRYDASEMYHLPSPFASLAG